MLLRISLTAGLLFCFLSVNASAQPSAFTGFVPMSELHLQEGFVRPYDNVSVFGWGGIVRLHHGKLHFTGPVVQTPLYFLGFPVVPQHIYAGIDTLRPSGMKPIFDGKTLEGWTSRGTIQASVVDGAIRLTGGLGSLESEGQYGDFVMQLEYFTPERPANRGVNTGVFFRCIPGEVMNGYECQIFNAEGETGSIFRRQAARNVEPKDGQWNYITLGVRGQRMAVWVNGIQVIHWTDERRPHDNPRTGLRTKPGTIQLQGHDPDTEVLFRNIRIREL